MAATDTFANFGDTALVMPASGAFAITPDDEEELETVTRGIYVGVAGDLAVTLVGDSAPVTFANLAAGIIHPIRAKRIHATGTDAEDIIGVY